MTFVGLIWVRTSVLYVNCCGALHRGVPSKPARGFEHCEGARFFNVDGSTVNLFLVFKGLLVTLCYHRLPAQGEATGVMIREVQETIMGSTEVFTLGSVKVFISGSVIVWKQKR